MNFMNLRFTKESWFLLGIFLGFISLAAEKDPVYNFSEIWTKVQESSLSQKSAKLDSQKAKIQSQKNSHHWLPRVYLDGRNYTTNDPALNFFSTLGQRKANDSDFSTASARTRISNFVDTNNQLYTTPNYNTLNLFAPDRLNNPGTNTYQRATLGVDLPLYEGGAKTEIAKMTEKLAEAKELERKYITLSEYSNFASMYATLNVLKEYQQNLINLEKKVDSLLNRYQLGNRANPVGYSGLLGLKNIKNRILGLREETRAKISSIREHILLTTSDLPANWETKPQNTKTFVSENFVLDSGSEDSLMSKAMTVYAETASMQANAEKARVLPKVGVYGEAYAYRGDRSTATAFNAGFYVQMNLYSPGDLDAIEEAKVNSALFKSKALEAKQREEIQKKTLKDANASLETNMEILENSTKLMDEQWVLAQQMFANGSLNAMQLAEVLNRKLDLVVQSSHLEMEYIKVKAALFTMNQNTIEGNK